MVLIEPFVAAFGLALISEIADKTQLVILGLALKYRAPWKVFAGAIGAHAFMDGIAIALGAFFGFTLPSNVIKIFVGTLFIALGLWALTKLYIKKSEEKDKKTGSKTPLTASFLTVLVSEFGDKTQIASGLLAAKYLVPISIFIGTVLALALVISLNVFVGSKVAKKIPAKTLKITTAMLFIIFGIVTIIF